MVRNPDLCARYATVTELTASTSQQPEQEIGVCVGICVYVCMDR